MYGRLLAGKECLGFCKIETKIFGILLTEKLNAWDIENWKLFENWIFGILFTWKLNPFGILLAGNLNVWDFLLEMWMIGILSDEIREVGILSAGKLMFRIFKTGNMNDWNIGSCILMI